MLQTSQRLLVLLSLSSWWLAGLAPAQQPASAKRRRPDPVFAPVHDDPSLPRVLLIGDSISIGYTLPTRKRLAGRANLHRIPTNGGPTTKGLAKIDAWLGPRQWDVIHFNWGLHDLKYIDDSGRLAEPSDGRQQVPLKVYEKNLEKLVRRLQRTGATLIWRNTTPVPPGARGRIVGDAQEYNAAAMKIMQRHHIVVQDLYRVSHERMAELMRHANVHYTKKGYAVLAARVADAIEKALAGRAPRPMLPPRKGRRETIELCNGKDLRGWRGDETHWSVKDGVIVARNDKPVPVSTYLVTERSFSDFRLTAKVKLVRSEMHSGIALWGRLAPEHGDPFTYAGHLVMFPSAWGFYDLYGRRGLPVNGALARAAGHQHDWNELEILAQGNRIRLVVNGKRVVDWYDPKPERIRKGPIGLQLHANKQPQEVWFKDLVLTAFPEHRLLTVR